MKLIILVAAILLTGAPAFASKVPQPCGHDSRLRCATYDQGQIFEIWTAPGGILVIQFSENESVPEGNVARTDGSRLSAVPRGNFLYLKSTAKQGETPCMVPEPLLITTKLSSGQLRPYHFQVETKPSDCSETPAAQTPQQPMVSLTGGANAAPKPPQRPGNLRYVKEGGLADGADVMYAVRFTYPGDDKAKREAAQRVRQAAEEEHTTRTLLKKPAAWSCNARSDPDNGNINYRYVARGSSNLVPSAACDNGHFTTFVFPALERVPALFRINPDGKEATVNPSVHRGTSDGDTIVAEGTAQMWRLRDGGTVMEIVNVAFDPTGDTPATGTVSPYVKRVLKGEEPDDH